MIAKQTTYQNDLSCMKGGKWWPKFQGHVHDSYPIDKQIHHERPGTADAQAHPLRFLCVHTLGGPSAELGWALRSQGCTLRGRCQKRPQSRNLGRWGSGPCTPQIPAGNGQTCWNKKSAQVRGCVQAFRLDNISNMLFNQCLPSVRNGEWLSVCWAMVTRNKVWTRGKYPYYIISSRNKIHSSEKENKGIQNKQSKTHLNATCRSKEFISELRGCCFKKRGKWHWPS